MIGQSIAHYRITAKLGEGGMGEVYRATDTKLGREVAVKVLPADYAENADRLRRFEQEAKTLAALNHPNVMTVFDVGQHDRQPYLVSELLEGRILRDELSSGALSVRKAIHFALQVAQGLAAAHGKGVVHRDLKPDNIFVTKDGRVKVLDFGLAKLRTIPKSKIQNPNSEIDPHAPTVVPHTEPGVVLGTAGYMSPEQVSGQEADHRSDFFAFVQDYLGAVNQAKKYSEKAIDLAQLKNAIQQFNAMEERFPKDLNELVQQHYLVSVPVPPRGMKLAYNPQTGEVRIFRQP
jgi:serine/threonine protein kinase